MPPVLHDRLLFLEARIAMLEDQVQILRSRAKLVVKSLVGWMELGLFYLVIRLIARYAPEKKGRP